MIGEAVAEPPIAPRLAVRRALPGDAAGIVQVLNPIIEARVFTVLDTPFTVEAERAFIERFPERGVFLVAVDEADGAIVGFQNVEPFGPYTRAFDHVGVIGTYVRLDRRREGIGARLFEATYEALARKGYEKLFTFVRGNNTAALAAYTRQGFRVVGTARAHARVDGADIDEIIIEKLLERAR